jgi:hypothetical protein
MKETINTRQLESLCFGGLNSSMLPCKTEHEKTEVQPTAQHKHKQASVEGKGISIYLNMSSMEQIKCTIYVNYPRIWTWALHWESLESTEKNWLHSKFKFRIMKR